MGKLVVQTPKWPSLCTGAGRFWKRWNLLTLLFFSVGWIDLHAVSSPDSALLLLHSDNKNYWAFTPREEGRGGGVLT